MTNNGMIKIDMYFFSMLYLLKIAEDLDYINNLLRKSLSNSCKITSGILRK